jgi:hypothetical protein
MSNQIIPDPEDFQAIESEHGALPPDAIDARLGSKARITAPQHCCPLCLQ